MLRTFDKKLGKALQCANDHIVEDISKKMERLVGQVNKLLKREGSPIYKYAQRAGVDPDPQQIIMSLAEFDPTGDSATYLPWIIKMAGQGMNLPEDGSSLHGALNKYHRIKRSPNFQGPKDIMRINNFPELLGYVRSGETKRRTRINISGWDQYVENFFDTGYYRVIRFDPRPYVGQEIEVIATKLRESGGEVRAVDWILKSDASPEQLQWAEENNEDTGSWRDVVCIAKVNPVVVPMMEISVKGGTVWCLANPKQAMDYLQKGPIYFFYKDNGSELFCSADNYFSFGSGEGGWVDVNNSDIMKISDRYATLLARMIVLGDSGKLEQLHENGLKNIGALMKRIVRNIKAKNVSESWFEPKDLQEGYSISAADLILKAYDIIQGA